MRLATRNVGHTMKRCRSLLGNSAVHGVDSVRTAEAAEKLRWLGGCTKVPMPHLAFTRNDALDAIRLPSLPLSSSAGPYHHFLSQDLCLKLFEFEFPSCLISVGAP